MDDAPRGLSIPEGDPVREFTAEEEQALTLNLKGLLRDIYKGTYAEWPLTPRLLFEFHSRLFDGVRSHAGKCRNRYFGQEWLVFGPHHSMKRSEVPSELERLFGRARQELVHLRELRSQCVEVYVEKAIRFAVQMHADVIRIHPFEDGNGRSSRALMSHLLLMLGLKPIPIEAPKQEYLECMNTYISDKQPGPLVDLCLRLYPLDESASTPSR